MLEERLKERLKDLEAVRFGEFTLRSGRKSSYYVDLKKAACDPGALALMAEAVIERIPEDVDRVAGLELGSVPIAAVVSVRKGLPMIIVRKEKKEHGTGNTIEGRVENGEKVLIIEDTTTTGGQILRAVRVIRNVGAVVEKAVVVVNRDEGADEALKAENVELISILTARDILEK